MTDQKYEKIRSDLRRAIRPKKPGDARRAVLQMRLEDHTKLKLAQETSSA